MRNHELVTRHNGQTGGYSSYLGLDLAHHRALVVLSDETVRGVRE
jgi:hypothetical protein